MKDKIASFQDLADRLSAIQARIKKVKKIMDYQDEDLITPQQHAFRDKVLDNLFQDRHDTVEQMLALSDEAYNEAAGLALTG